MTSAVPAVPVSPAARPMKAPAGDGRKHRPGPVTEWAWGTAQSIAAGPDYRIERRVILPGRMLPLRYRRRSAEHLTVVGGEVHLTIGDDTMVLEPDDSFYVPLGAMHRLANRGGANAVVIAVQCGSDAGDDDIVPGADGTGGG